MPRALSDEANGEFSEATDEIKGWGGTVTRGFGLRLAERKAEEGSGNEECGLSNGPCNLHCRGVIFALAADVIAAL